MTPGCSVIVCCYNSKSRLPETLAHLSRQQLRRGIRWEVVLVDNASTDGTALAAVESWTALGDAASLRVVHEPEPGLAQARRTGVLAASHDIIVFCDDDNWLAPDYLQRACDTLRERPNIGLVGGRISPVWEGGGGFPDWFFAYAGSYAVGAQALRSCEIPSGGYIWGAGMAVRAAVLRRVFEKVDRPLLSGRKGSKMTSGDDTEICKWIVIAGYGMWYDEEMQMSHFIPKGRQSVEYVERLHGGFKAASELLATYDAWVQRRRARKEWLKHPLRALRKEARFCRMFRALGESRSRFREIVALARAQE